MSPRATPGHTRAPRTSSLPGPMMARSPTTTPSKDAPAPITAQQRKEAGVDAKPKQKKTAEAEGENAETVEAATQA